MSTSTLYTTPRPVFSLNQYKTIDDLLGDDRFMQYAFERYKKNLTGGQRLRREAQETLHYGKSYDNVDDMMDDLLADE